MKVILVGGSGRWCCYDVQMLATNYMKLTLDVAGSAVVVSFGGDRPAK